MKAPDSRLPKEILLTEEERKTYQKFKWYSHYDPVTDENTYDEYNSRLKSWTNDLRKKHKMDDNQPFFVFR